jgi:hypothetical protein
MLRADLGLTITGSHPYIPIPFWVRLPLAVLIVVWGAQRDRRWTVAVAVTLTLPTIWVQSLPVLLGAVPSLTGWPPLAQRREGAHASRVRTDPRHAWMVTSIDTPKDLHAG